MTTLLDTPPVTPTRPAPAGIPFGRLLRVEWTKLTDTRSSRWLIALVALGTVGLMLAPLLAQNSIDQTFRQYLEFGGIAVTVLLPVVAVLTMTSEWSQRTVLTTFAWEPRRSRVVAAKVGAVGLLTALAVVVAGAIVAAFYLIATATGRHMELDLGAAVLIGFALNIVLNMALAVGFGAVIQQSAAAIVAMFALPIAFGLLSAPLGDFGRWIDPTRSLNWVATGDWHGHVGPIVVTMLIWVAAPLAAGIVRTVRREIS